jgi:hypothetical protein
MSDFAIDMLSGSALMQNATRFASKQSLKCR